MMLTSESVRIASRQIDSPALLPFSRLLERGPSETLFTQPSDLRIRAYVEGARVVALKGKLTAADLPHDA